MKASLTERNIEESDIGLQDCRLTCRTVTDEARLYLVIQACMVLHNLLAETWKDSLTTSEVAGVMNIDDRAAGVGDQVANRRRDEVVAEMIRDEVHRDRRHKISFVFAGCPTSGF